LDQLWKAADLDVSHNVVLVMGIPYKTLVGLGIGSPLSAGGAALCAAWREELSLRLLADPVRAEIRTKTFIRRWLDDLLVIFTSRMSDAAMDYLRILQDEQFYGERLLLKRVWDPEPFGFALGFLQEEGRLAVVARSRMPFIERSPIGPGWRKCASALTGAKQFRPARTQLAVATGFLARYMDLSTEPRGLFTIGILRTLTELKNADFEEAYLRRALAKYAYSTHGFLRPLLAAVKWTPEQCCAFNCFYDAMDQRLREEARLRMISFAVGVRR